MDSTIRAAPAPEAAWADQLDSGCAIRSRRERGLPAIERNAAAWNALAHAGPWAPTADAIWAACHWKAFGRPGRDLCLHLFEADGQHLAVVPAERSVGLWRTWRSAGNAHWPFLAFAARPTPQTAAAVVDRLFADADAIEWRDVHTDDDWIKLIIDAARQRGHTVVITPRAGDAAIHFDVGWPALRERLSRKLVTNTERAIRRLGEQGDRQVHCYKSFPDLAKPLEACLALEAAGWKGARGSPILASPQTSRFYHALAERSAENNRFALYVLQIDRRIIAFHYCIRAQQQMHMLKISYDPEWAAHSPGNVLLYEVIRREIERGDILRYHLGRPSEWKLRWSPVVHPLGTVRLFKRSWRGTLALLAGPRAETWIKQYPLMASAARRLRRR